MNEYNCIHWYYSNVKYFPSLPIHVVLSKNAKGRRGRVSDLRQIGGFLIILETLA